MIKGGDDADQSDQESDHADQSDHRGDNVDQSDQGGVTMLIQRNRFTVRSSAGVEQPSATRQRLRIGRVCLST